MPFCPKCHYEYNTGVAECPDCGEKLVDHLPAEAEAAKEYKDWIALARLHSPEMSEMIIESLRSKDIPAVIKSGVGYFGYVGTQGMSSYAPVGGGYTLLVPEDYLADAIEEVKIILGEDDWNFMKLVDIDQ